MGAGADSPYQGEMARRTKRRWPGPFATTSRRGQSNPLSADSGTPSAKIYGPLITLGLQNHFHSRQPK